MRYKKKSRRDEPNWAIVCIYMEVPEENSLCSYLKQKCHFFLLLFLYKIRGQESGTGPAGGGAGVEGGERVWKGEYYTNTVYTCM
jgi:hypothetical protein